MRGLGQPERHDWNQALPACQHTSVMRRDFGQNPQRLVNRLRHVTNEGRGFHAVNLPASPGLIICIQTINGASGLSNSLARPAAAKRIPQDFRRHRQIHILIAE
jgi:hypothetical protein